MLLKEKENIYSKGRPNPKTSNKKESKQEREREK